MKAIRSSLVALTLLLTLTVCAAAAGVQLQQAPAQEEKVFQGSLVKIDTTAHMIVAKDTANKEWQFSYTDKTEVVTPEKTIQGLAGKSGATVRIMYTVQQGANQATRIEISEK
jgi:hypothetical protein